jgi:hypothetical protein
MDAEAIQLISVNVGDHGAKKARSVVLTKSFFPPLYYTKLAQNIFVRFGISLCHPHFFQAGMSPYLRSARKVTTSSQGCAPLSPACITIQIQRHMWGICEAPHTRTAWPVRASKALHLSVHVRRTQHKLSPIRANLILQQVQSKTRGIRDYGISKITHHTSSILRGLNVPPNTGARLLRSKCSPIFSAALLLSTNTICNRKAGGGKVCLHSWL